MVMEGPARGRELHLEVVGSRYRVGRGTGCNLVVPDDDISREHAEFERRWDGVFVRDLNSKNGVSHMGERLAGEQRLADGDVLRLGQTTLRLEDPEDRYLRQMEEVAQAGLPNRPGQPRRGGGSIERPAGRSGRGGTPGHSHLVSRGGQSRFVEAGYIASIRACRARAAIAAAYPAGLDGHRGPGPGRGARSRPVGSPRKLAWKK